MGDFGDQQGSAEWAERKKLMIRCPTCHSLIDPNIGCKECGIEESLTKPIPKAVFDPFRMVKQGYKLHAGSYWKRIYENDGFKGITMTDHEGRWLKVSQEEATVKLEGKESATLAPKIEEPPLPQEKNKRKPIWEKLYPPEEKYS